MYSEGSGHEGWSKFIDQLLALIAFFAFPAFQYILLRHRSKNEGEINLWYLPAYGFRLVIRNLPKKHTLSEIKYRVISRRIVPALANASVATFVDSTLQEKENFFLFPGTDQVLLCFRVEGSSKEELTLTITDKLGHGQEKIPLRDFDKIICDYTATLNNLFNFNVRLAKRGEILSSTLSRLCEEVRADNSEASFEIDRVRNAN